MEILSPDDYTKLRAQLSHHEGRRSTPYRCTAGKLTIGVGYNIDDRGLEPLCRAILRKVTLNDLISRGLTDAEIDLVLNADILYFGEKAAQYLGADWENLSGVRRRAVIDFVFNVGLKGALRFPKAVKALKNAISSLQPERQRLYYIECAFEMMRSLWYTQVGDGFGKRYDRAERVTDMIVSGQEPSF